MGDGNHQAPPEDTYGRVTNPGRYRVIHRAARELIEQLVAEYMPRREDGTGLDPTWADASAGSPATKLTPSTGAPLTFTFTTFPGVLLRYGYCGEASFPSCGCDACDEDPEEEAGRMVQLVRDVVAGGFAETRRQRPFRRDWYESLLVGDKCWSRGGGLLTESDRADELPVGTTEWAPWEGP